MKYEEWLRRIIVVVAEEYKMTEAEKGNVWEGIRKKIIQLIKKNIKI